MRECAELIDGLQREGYDEYGMEWTPGPGDTNTIVPGTYHYLDWWLAECIGGMYGRADSAYQFGRIGPRELGFDIVLRRGPECAINRWYPGNKEKLKSLFPVYFGAP